MPTIVAKLAANDSDVASRILAKSNLQKGQLGARFERLMALIFGHFRLMVRAWFWFMVLFVEQQFFFTQEKQRFRKSYPLPFQRFATRLN